MTAFATAEMILEPPEDSRVLRVDNIHTIVSDIIFDAQVSLLAQHKPMQQCVFSGLLLFGLAANRCHSFCSAFIFSIVTDPFDDLILFLFSLINTFLHNTRRTRFVALIMRPCNGRDTSVALAIMVEEYERKYGKRIVNSWILMVSCALAVLTFSHIKNSHKMSVQMSELQRTLCAQSAVPILCVYWPYVFAINGSFLNIPGNLLHDLCAPVLTFFPVWDPVIVILLFNDYRNGLKGVVRKPPPVGPTTMQVTTTFANTASIDPSSVATTSELIEEVNNVIGALSNGLLLFLVVRYSRKELGTYKYLLISFASFDIFLCALHSFVKPKLLSVGQIFCAVAHSPVESRWVTSCFTSFFSVPFSLMMIHFAYRFVSIRMPEKIALFADKRVIALVVLFPTATFAAWYSGIQSKLATSIVLSYIEDPGPLAMFRVLMQEEYNLNVLDGYVLMNHSRTAPSILPTVALVIAFVIMTANFTIATVLATHTYHYISSAKQISFSTKKETY
uniref:G protein-coupled receptor n=1 Tax=Pristionchus pacificus TaxID=54126 RepID=A0A8R1YZ91_PRIPA